MTDRTASNTALGVAWLNAAHQVIDAEPRILDDPAIGPLLGATVEGIVERREWLQRPGARALRSHVVLRARVAEEHLAQAIARGVRQYVILGAGFDTFAYRQPAWASELRVFEVDQPATQAAKRERVTSAGLVVPPNVTYVAIDFETESLHDGLGRGGVRLDAPVFFSWLGVSMYLTESAVDAVLGFVASLPLGTEIVFTFAQPPASPEEASLADRAAAVGEPWLTYFEPHALGAKLEQLGFSAVAFVTREEAESRWFRGRADGLPAPRRISVCSARV